jgi:hypothetical protein
MACWTSIVELHDSQIQRDKPPQRKDDRGIREWHWVTLQLSLKFTKFQTCWVIGSPELGVLMQQSLAIAKEIELGSGTIYITDQANMVDIMSANINLNHPLSRIIACELDWYKSPFVLSCRVDSPQVRPRS